MQILFKDIVVYETANFRVEQDWGIPIAGFFVIVAKRQVRSVADFTEAEVIDFANCLRKVRLAMQQTLSIDTIYLFQNEDTVHNFHLWLVPRYEWMSQFGKRIESVRPSINYAIANMSSPKEIEAVKLAASKVAKSLHE